MHVKRDAHALEDGHLFRLCVLDLYDNFKRSVYDERNQLKIAAPSSIIAAIMGTNLADRLIGVLGSAFAVLRGAASRVSGAVLRGSIWAAFRCLRFCVGRWP